MAEYVEGDDTTGLDFSTMESCYNIKRLENDLVLGEHNQILYATKKLVKGQVIGLYQGFIHRVDTHNAKRAIREHKGWVMSLHSAGMDSDSYILDSYHLRKIKGVHIANSAENRFPLVNNAYLESILRKHLVKDSDKCNIDVYLVANQDIEIGQEICVSYGRSFFD